MKASTLLVAGGLGVAALVAVSVVGLTATTGTPPPAAVACGTQPIGGVQTVGEDTVAAVPQLNPAQLGIAGTVVAVGEQLQVPPQGIVTALAVVSQESSFQNYANDGQGTDLRPEQRGVERSLTIPHDAVGTDHGSIGIAQQQYPWWGTIEELMDPATAARLFYERLITIIGWEQLPVTVAAQKVQASLYPDAYADDEPLARTLYAQLAGAGAAAGDLATPAAAGVAGALCGSGAALDCPPTGLPAEDGLTPDGLRVLRCVQANLGEHTYGGVGTRGNNPQSDHPAGRAVDVMIDGWDTPAGKAHGDQVAAYVVDNAAGLGVKYVIWNAQILTIARAEQGWLPYTHPSGGTSPTLLHLDHVHVSVHGDAATTAGGASSDAVSAAGWTLPVDPATAVVTSGYGPRISPTGGSGTFHAGLDFGAPSGTPIRAAAAGEVTRAGPAGGFGNLVVLRTGNVDTYYAHQVDGGIRVAVGDQVGAGQVIGAVGSTGNSTGPHLHFETRVDGQATDPAVFLARYGVTLPSGAAA